MNRPDAARIAEWESALPEASRQHLHQAADKIVAAKERGGAISKPSARTARIRKKWRE